MDLAKSIDQPGQILRECAKQIIGSIKTDCKQNCDVCFAIQDNYWSIDRIYSLEFSDIEAEERKINPPFIVNEAKDIQIRLMETYNYHHIQIYDVNPVLLPKGTNVKIVVLFKVDADTDISKIIHDAEAYIAVAILKLNILKTSSLHSEFLANMSHKIRTPLTNIMHSIHNLRDMRLSGPQEELVSATYNGSLELATVINDIIDLTKLQNKKLVLKPERFCLENWTTETLEPFRLEAQLKGIELKIFIDDNVPRFIVTDPKRLSQILVKLIDNAIRYTPISAANNPIVIQLSADSCFTGRTLEYNIAFRITDHGIGIPDNIIQLINQPLSPGVDEHERLSKIGFGIAVAKKMLELFGGKLLCSSTPPQLPSQSNATTFTFNIVVDGLESSKIDTDSFKYIRNKNVLVVDHDQKRGLEIALNLKRWGINTTLARASEEVVLLHLTQPEKLDLAIIDDQIKIKSAVQLAQKIKELNPKINLICVSNVEHSDQSDHPIFDRSVVLPLEMPNLMTIILDIFVSKQGLSNYRGAHLKYVDYSILIVDDDPNNQIVLDRMLRYFGCNNIVFKNNGKDAYNYIKEGLAGNESQTDVLFDIIFTDIKMPLMNGIELAQMLRELMQINEKFKPSIIGVSAQPELDDLNPSTPTIFDGFVAKPIERAELNKVILSVLS
jgi:signal transduction histidine kinase/CheY-like chemotaxis protein